MNPKAGDKIKVTTSDGELIGIFMPNKETDAMVLKLDNGYNVGIDSKKIKKIEIIEHYKEKKKDDEKKPAHAKNKKTICILHTGGTIASKVDYRTGGVVARFSPEEIISMFPELDKIANIKSKLIANMFSEDLRFVHCSMIAKEAKNAIDGGADGIIITHGTDTMHYSSAAMSFMLDNLPVPVIFVGAQRSSDRGSSDAGVNLICAAEFIAKSDFTGVGICMHEGMDDENCLILPACKTRKMHTSRRDAFKAVNDTPIARINYTSKKIEFINKDYPKKTSHPFALKDKMEEKVAILKVHPNMFPEQFLAYKGYKGLIIEGTGLGQAPVGTPNEFCKVHEKIMEAIKELIDSGTIVCMASQALFGKVSMHVYSNAIDLANAGVISAEDMLPETAFIKLAWLLGNYPKEKAKELIAENLRGEINQRLQSDMFL